MDPTTPDGHRLFALSILTANYPAFYPAFASNQDIAQALQKVVSTKADLGCELRPESERIIDSITSDKIISNEEWASVKKMLARTGKAASMEICGKVVWQDIKGPIPIEERADFFAKADCAPSRDAKFRGKSISELVRPDYSALTKPLRINLMKKYRGCISG